MRMRQSGKAKYWIGFSMIWVLIVGMGGCQKNNILPAQNSLPDYQESIETQIKQQETEKESITESTTEETTQEKKEIPQIKVKGIYITGPMAGNEAMNSLIDLLDQTELNAVVVDIKNDNGEITYHMEHPLVQQIDASIRYIPDIKVFLQNMKEHGIYTIARIVCFKDPILAAAKPELAMMTPEGKVITDGKGLAWVNPYQREVWEYLVGISKMAAEDGFDEIQYDYVRFATGKDAESVDFQKDGDTRTKQEVITGFLSYACETLHPLGVQVSADVFGTIMGSEVDTALIGQDYTSLGSIVDSLCPMVYPSHYGTGVFGLDIPDANPYETVYHAMLLSQEELNEIPISEKASVRAWLQAFTASWIDGHISYGGEQIRSQIQAVYDAGYEEWILWDASNRYRADGLLIEEIENEEMTVQ